MFAEALIEQAAEALIGAASAPAKVILFDSRARGDADGSDFDFLVIESEVADHGAGPSSYVVRLETLVLRWM